MDAVDRERYGLKDRPSSAENSSRIARKKELVELYTEKASKLLRREITVSEFAEDEAEKHLKLEDEAEYDPLTGLLNRRGFVSAFDNRLLVFRRALHQSAEQGSKLTAGCLVILDLDHFGQVNKEYGEDFGDITLQQVAAILAEGVRPEDIIARFGGEEFVIFYPQTELEDACRSTERLRTTLPHQLSSKLSDQQLTALELHASFGIVALPGDLTEEGLFDPTARSLIFNNAYKQAVRAMRFVKETGRNQIAIGHADANPEIVTPFINQSV